MNEHLPTFNAMKACKEDAQSDNLDWLHFLYLLYGYELVQQFKAWESEQRDQKDIVAQNERLDDTHKR